MIWVIADHKGFRDITGDVQHHALFLSGGQILPGALAVTALVQVEYTNNPMVGDNFILA